MKTIYLVKVKGENYHEYEGKYYGPRSLAILKANEFLKEGYDVIIRKI